MRSYAVRGRFVASMLVAGVSACSHQHIASSPSADTAPTVQGRVLWNEQPARGAHAYATSEYNFASTHYGDATTDSDGRFRIRGISPGQKYLYVFGNGPEYWVSAVTPFMMPAAGNAIAADTYLCKGFDPIAPARNEIVRTSRPLLQWASYADAVDYAVRVLRTGERNFIFSRGDRDPHLTTTAAQVDVDLPPGEYTWRVDAFNRFGHIIACSRYPRPFVITAR